MFLSLTASLLVNTFFCKYNSFLLYLLRWPWCNCYRRRKWTRRHEFKSWTWLIAFHIALIPLGKVWIQLFSFQLWVNSRTDWLSLLHLISIFSGPQTPSGFPRAPSVRCGFPFHIWSLALWNSTGNCFLDSNSTELNNNSMPTRSPTGSLKSNRHQAEITVMQFRGHSLPVHQSVLAQCDLYLVPYYKP